MGPENDEKKDACGRREKKEEMLAFGGDDVFHLNIHLQWVVLLCGARNSTSRWTVYMQNRCE